MRLNNKTFKIGTLRCCRRQKLGRISNFKWLEAALNLVEIKNPFGSVQTNPQANAWWVPLFISLKKVFFWNTLIITHTSWSLLSLIVLHQIPPVFADKTAENANTTMCIICKIYLIFFNISFAQYLSIFQLNLKLDRPVLLGHSQGGWLAQIYAAVFPDKVMYIVYRTKTSLL